MYQDCRIIFVTTQQGRPETVVDARVLAAARSVLSEHGLAGLTMVQLSAASELSRMTLHRRRVTVAAVIELLVEEVGREYLAAVLPALTGPGTAAVRLRSVMRAILTVADAHLPLLAGLFSDRDSFFHAHAPTEQASGPAQAVATAEIFTTPLSRLLRDGVVDGTLRVVTDPDHTAATLFNVVGWGYIHLRHAQRWTAEVAADAVLDLALVGLEQR